MKMSRAMILAIVWVVLCAGVARSQDAVTEYVSGQKVEIREGDVWSPGQFVKREGRRLQVRYDDGTEEWVTADRLRPTPAAAADGKAPAKEAAAAPAPPPAPPKPKWTVGQMVDASWGSQWWVAKIIARKGDNYEVELDGRNFRVSVTPDCIRTWTKGARGPYSIGRDEEWASRGRLGNPRTEPAPSTDAASAVKWKVGDLVEAKDGGFWTKAKVIQAQDGRYKVSYEGWPSNFDAWVTSSSIRERNKEQKDQAASAAARALGEQNLSSVKVLTLIGGDSSWRFRPDPAVNPVSMPDGSLPLNKDKSRAGVLDMFVTDGAAWVVRGALGVAAGGTCLERIDMTSGDNSKAWFFKGRIDILSVSPDGKRVVARPTERAKLEVFSIEDAEPKSVASFVPYPNNDDATRVPNWVAMIDANHLLTVSGPGSNRAVLWELPACKAIWTAQIGLTRPALSPGGKQLAIFTNDWLVILDPLTGETLDSLHGGSASGWVSFSGDGSRLAIVGSQSLETINLVEGKRSLSMSIPASEQSIDVVWAGNDFILVGQTLLSLEKRAPVWRYRHPDAGFPIRCVGGRVWYVVTDPEPALVLTTLPHAQARQAADALRPEDYYYVFPGCKLSLQVNLATDATTAAKVAKGLPALLATRQISVVDGQPIKMVVTSTPGPVKEVKYQTTYFGRGPMQQEVVTKNITTTVLKLALVGPDGKEVYAYEHTIQPPPMPETKDGQTLDDAIAECMKPSAELFSWYLPNFIPRNTDLSRMGTTKLTVRGGG